jgi:hypothetical protein
MKSIRFFSVLLVFCGLFTVAVMGADTSLDWVVKAEKLIDKVYPKKVANQYAKKRLNNILSLNLTEEQKIQKIKEFMDDLQDTHRENKKVTAEKDKPRRLTTAEITERLVICKGNYSTGTGFILKFKDHLFIVTNAHVFFGNSKMKFSTTKDENIAVSRAFIPSDTRDLMFFLIKDFRKKDYPYFLLADMDPKKVNIGTEILNYGNNAGAGVVTEEKGKILGIGPKIIETDLKNVQGSSGSPIIVAKTGRVVGVETFATKGKTNWVTEGTRYAKKRNFGTRIDTMKGVIRFNVNQYKMIYQRYKRISERAMKFYGLYQAVQKHMGLVSGAGTSSRNMLINKLRSERTGIKKQCQYMSDHLYSKNPYFRYLAKHAQNFSKKVDYDMDKLDYEIKKRARAAGGM